MTTIPSSSITRFLAAAGLALALPLVQAAGPGGQGECGGAERLGPAERRGPDMGSPGGLPGEQAPHYLRALNLSEAQRDKVFDILHGQAPALRSKGKVVRQAEDELRRLPAAPDYSEARAKALADTVGRALADISLTRAHSDRQIYDLLTPEQRRQLAEMKPAAEPHGPQPEGRAPAGR